MAAQPIEWHEECLRCFEKSIEKQIDEMDRVKKKFMEDFASLSFYRMQVLEAKRRGKKAFDADRFLVKRGD